MTLRRTAPGLLVLAFAACDSMGPEEGARLAVNFATVTSTASASFTGTAGSDLILTGSNGQLRITSMHMIVSEFEVKRDRSACESRRDRGDDDDDDVDHGRNDCRKFEAGPFFLELPLTGSVSVVSQDVPAGAYTELEFEVNDLRLDDDDDDDDDDDRGLTDLQAAIRAAGFAEWPRDASLVVRGDFTPTGGTARAFTTFLEAEIEIELEFEPPLLNDEAQRTVTVEIDPSLWFRTFTNTVIDLSAFDYATTRKVMEFKAKLKDGFQKMGLKD